MNKIWQEGKQHSMKDRPPYPFPAPPAGSIIPCTVVWPGAHIPLLALNISSKLCQTLPGLASERKKKRPQNDSPGRVGWLSDTNSAEFMNISTFYTMNRICLCSHHYWPTTFLSDERGSNLISTINTIQWYYIDWVQY